ncbi:SRPBCC domain-containing protein [Undibacterium arcticum]|uniref:SRPBCC domain-containing protein n=1 Tax=Undibacterium arcticum TaxID=1762892 RepID=A0ABV7EZG7_9BURK
MNTATTPQAPAAGNEFVISRLLDAPRTLVFQAWTDPTQMARWFGPHNFTNPVCEIDLRVGGAHRIVMRSPDGVDYPIKGVYREIVAPERLVMTLDCSEHPDAWHDMVKPNRARDERNPAGEMLSTVTFEDVDGKTKLTIRTRFESATIRDAMLKMGMTEGWTESLERLAAHLAKA